MRIAGLRIGAPVARLLSGVVRAEGYPATADKITDAIERQITLEAPLTLEDHQAVLEALSRTAPPASKGSASICSRSSVTCDA